MALAVRFCRGNQICVRPGRQRRFNDESATERESSGQNQTDLVYDTVGRKTKETLPAVLDGVSNTTRRPVITLSMDVAGNLTQRKMLSGCDDDYFYDALNRQRRQTSRPRSHGTIPAIAPSDHHVSIKPFHF